MMTDIDNSLLFISEFADKYLQGNLDKFLDFPLYQVRLDKTFGPVKRKYDADDVEIMRHLYIVLFHNVWPDMTFDSLKSLEFRGDTLNTYNTMFGQPNDLTPHPGLDKFETSDHLRRKVATFRYRYSFIGNMAVLPNLIVNNETINTYRGKHGKWKDFFDQFLFALKDILTGKQPQDVKLAKLIEANAKYFEPYQGEQGFRNFVDGLLLTDYVDADYNPIISSKGYYWWSKKLASVDYETEALRYIDFANSVIEHRTRLMVNRLKEIL